MCVKDQKEEMIVMRVLIVTSPRRGALQEFFNVVFSERSTLYATKMNNVILVA